MTDAAATSSRIFVRYAGASKDCLPTEVDIREIFSTYGSIVEVDMRAKFCFVEYDSHTAAQKAIDAEDGRDFKGTNLKVEIALGARKVRGNDTDSTALGSGTDKKSSFATNEWLAQCKAANISTDICPATSEQKEVSSSQNENNLKAASKQRTESHGQERCRTSPVDRRNSSTNVVKQLESQRHRSRSPVNSTRPAAQAGNSRSYQSRSPSSQMEQLRRNEVQLGQLWNQRPPASMLSSPESARIGAKLMYASEVKSGAHRGMYDRELPSPIASSNNASRSVIPSPIKSALRQPTTPSAPVEAYLTRYAQEVPETTATSSRYQQFDRSIDYALSQMKNASKQVSPLRYDDMVDRRMESSLTPQRPSTGGTRCEIFIRDTSQSDYAKFVAMRIERIGLLVHVSVLRANVDIEDEVAEAMNRGCAFALCLSVIGFQSSTTLYILHGDPEEHRNMLLEDAVAMITQSYAEYCRRRQTKQSSVNSMSVAEPLSRAQPGSTSSSLSLVPEQLRPDTTTRRLIGLLSADCQLTYTELEHVISYLKLRQKVLLRE